MRRAPLRHKHVSRTHAMLAHPCSARMDASCERPLVSSPGAWGVIPWHAEPIINNVRCIARRPYTNVIISMSCAAVSHHFAAFGRIPMAASPSGWVPFPCRTQPAHRPVRSPGRRRLPLRLKRRPPTRTNPSPSRQTPTTSCPISLVLGCLPSSWRLLVASGRASSGPHP